MAMKQRNGRGVLAGIPQAALGLMASMLVFGAHAQAAPDSTEPTIDVQLFYPTPSVGGFFSTEGAEVTGHTKFSSGVMVNWAHNPLRVRLIEPDGTSNDVGAVIANRVDLNILAAVGLFDIAELGLVMPVVYQGGFDKESFDAANIGLGGGLVGLGAGGLRIIPKIKVISVGEGAFAAAIIPSTVTIPVGKADWARENGMVLAPSLALSSRTSFLRFGFNAGYRMRDRTEVQTLVVDDEIFFKLAAAMDINFGKGTPLEVVAEVHGHTPADNPYASKTTEDLAKQFEKARSPLELDVGVRMRLSETLLLSGGVGGGLMPGYGAPAPRVFAGLMYFTGDVGPADEDKDGVPDESDKCPTRKEDRDGFEDEDGCPEFDNDKDNVLDEDDQCPNEKEDRDGFEDEDGCPEPDNDKDGILDADDKCPSGAEDMDGFEDEDGCPDLDNDADGIADAVDKCPLQAEDNDGFKDSDGCPEEDNDEDGLADLNDLCPNHAEDKDGVADDDGCPEDNDGDGILDADDKCPNKAETYNGIDDEDGCPEKLKAKSLVRVTEDKIEIKEKVFFKSNSAKIKSKSFKLLDQVASVLKNYKHLTLIHIEGHTDSKGSKRKNRRLSKDRAEAVREYLISRGIDPKRLEAKGYGPDRPIASNRSKRGREQNRRVEFVIMEQKPMGVDVSEGQEPPPPAEAPADEGGGGTMFEIGGEETTGEQTAPEEKKEEAPADEGGGIEFEF